MTNLLEEAVRVLRELPDDRLETAVPAIIDYIAERNDVQLSDEQVAEIDRRVANRNRKFICLADLGTRQYPKNRAKQGRHKPWKALE